MLMLSPVHAESARSARPNLLVSTYAVIYPTSNRIDEMC